MRKSLAIVALAALVLGTTVVVAAPASADQVGVCIYDSNSGTWDCSKCYNVGDVPKVVTRCATVW